MPNILTEDLEEMGHVMELAAEVNEMLKKDPFLKGYQAVLMVNRNPAYEKETKGLRCKPVGPQGANVRMLPIYCPTGCGCKLNTDGDIYWCSGIFCDWIGEEATL